MTKSLIWVGDPWEPGGAFFPDAVHVRDRLTHSRLLGPNGEPLAYETIPFGFNLTGAK